MDEQPLQLPPAVDGYSAHDLRSVERYLLEACEERGRMMEEIAGIRRRIAEAEAELAKSSETELRLARLVIDAQRIIREERQANDRALAAIRTEGEARAERTMTAAREQVAAMRVSLRGLQRPAPHPGYDTQVAR